MSKLTPVKATAAATATVGIGAAIGIIVTWLIGFAVDVPNPVAGAINGVSIWLTQRFPNIFATSD